MRIAFYTLGCKVNQYETELLSSLFHREGFDIVPFGDEADVYVVNSCTVTSTGDSKTRKVLRRIKREHPHSLAVLTGCFPQAFPDAAKQLPEADVITGSKDRYALAGAVRRALSTGERVVDIAPHSKDEAFERMSVSAFSERTRAFVKIEDGCERYCSYCIIPKARGFIRSKPLDALKQELSGLAENGYREAVLVGINLSSYGKDLGLRLADAVETACSVDGIERVRLGSLEPELLSDEEILRMSRQSKLCPQFHLALQSGCDETLKRMNRHYDTAEYRRIADRLRACFPGCAITTDIMVGFPGETDADFETSLSFVRSVGFARAHVFPYSIREGTRAASMDGQLDRTVKEERSRRMMKVAEESAASFLKAQVGQTVPVLFESKQEGLGFHGYTTNYSPVVVRTDEQLTGEIRPVLITEAAGGFCIGRILTG
ncbi:MAG: tRNA (N(6)-L-threonylcarbamoyladenosine(37)-C(2))-methylthiotransferase MtaB [Oscillospiraceae bacterium]|nr:tRNA (N(6)-L-threonylcarbamoyladenosine(37)-C(2))-methylthiotransferase MtaB [Oscillospiraceae bacterium]